MSMSSRFMAFLVVCVLGILPFGSVLAQEGSGDGEVEVLTTLGTITGDSAQFYGQEVTTEGYVEELLNVRVFVLSDRAALIANQVLVINNTGSEFDLQLVRDRQVRLVGTVYPSINEGGLGQLGSGDATNPAMESTVEPGMEMTEEMMVEPTMTSEPMTGDMGDANHTVDFSLMSLPDGFNDYTIIVLDSLETITYIVEE